MVSFLNTNGNSGDKCDDGNKLCTLCFKPNHATKERKRSKSFLELQAKRIKYDSGKKFPPAPVGASVRVPIPEIDKVPILGSQKGSNYSKI